MDPKQVHMAPFGLIFIQDGSHKLWDASRASKPPQKIQKSGFSRLSKIFSYFPIIPQQQQACLEAILVEYGGQGGQRHGESDGGEHSPQLQMPVLAIGAAIFYWECLHAPLADTLKPV